MKPKMFCPMCGAKITRVSRRVKETDTVIIHYEFICSNCGTIVAVIGVSEEAARKAWRKGLVGSMHKWRKYWDNHHDKVRALDSFLIDIVLRLTGGDQ